MSRETVASGPSSRVASVLLVDDHRLFAEVLAMRLRSDGGMAHVETAYGLGPARALVNVLQPDLVLLDLNLGEEHGLDLIADLDRMPHRPRVLIVSAVRETPDIVDALESGADGWVGKDTDLSVLLQAIDTLMRGDLYLPPSLWRPVVQQLLHESRGAPQGDSFLDALSARELEVLRCLVAGMTRAEVAARLFISANTVRTHVQNLLKRADLHSTGALVAAARDLRVPGIDDPWPRAGHGRGHSSR